RHAEEERNDHHSAGDPIDGPVDFHEAAHNVLCVSLKRIAPANKTSMPRLAANLTMMFNEVGFLDRFEAAAAAGFKAVEYLFPYEYDARVLKETLARCGLTQVLHNLPGGNWA